MLSLSLVFFIGITTMTYWTDMLVWQLFEAGNRKAVSKINERNALPPSIETTTVVTREVAGIIVTKESADITPTPTPVLFFILPPEKEPEDILQRISDFGF